MKKKTWVDIIMLNFTADFNREEKANEVKQYLLSFSGAVLSPEREALIYHYPLVDELLQKLKTKIAEIQVSQRSTDSSFEITAFDKEIENVLVSGYGRNTQTVFRILHHCQLFSQKNITQILNYSSCERPISELALEYGSDEEDGPIGPEIARSSLPDFLDGQIDADGRPLGLECTKNLYQVNLLTQKNIDRVCELLNGPMSPLLPPVLHQLKRIEEFCDLNELQKILDDDNPFMSYMETVMPIMSTTPNLNFDLFYVIKSEFNKNIEITRNCYLRNITLKIAQACINSCQQAAELSAGMYASISFNKTMKIFQDIQQELQRGNSVNGLTSVSTTAFSNRNISNTTAQTRNGYSLVFK